jgi:biopolymer transport protein ExbB/biopolymer transport protein TolQ
MLIQKLVFVSQLGASAVLYLLIALSVVSIGFIVERWWYFKKRKFDLAETSAALQKKLRARDVEGARAMLGKSKAVEAEILVEALEVYEDGPESFSEILQKAIRQRRKAFEAGLLFLGTLGNNAPFVGLFGTVLGVVSAFKELGNTTANAASGGGMGNVMGGISEALIATGIGILVALPAVIAYNIFQKRSGDVEESSQALGNVVLASLKADRNHGTRLGDRVKSGGDPDEADTAVRERKAKAEAEA